MGDIVIRRQVMQLIRTPIDILHTPGFLDAVARDMPVKAASAGDDAGYGASRVSKRIADSQGRMIWTSQAGGFRA